MSTDPHIAHRSAYASVHPRCHVLRVAPSAYDAWRRQPGQPVPEPAWPVAVRVAVAYQAPRYGTRRLRAEGQAPGHAVGRWRIRRVRKGHGLRAQPPRAFVPRTTDADPAVRAAPNRLFGQPAPLPRTGPGWATARTCPARAAAGATRPAGSTAARAKWWAGTCALAMPEDLVSAALRRALAVRRPPAGRVGHAD